MQGIMTWVENFFTKGHQRTLAAKKNIAISLLVRVLSIGITFLLVPMTINYVNPNQYGIWLTLSSIIGWFNFFDIGLGNGLKNKLAAANALGQYKQAKIYISTTYALLTIISVIIFVVFILLNNFISWAAILNTPNTPGLNLNQLSLLIVVFFCLQFILQLLNTVLTANHQPAKVSIINLLGQIVSIAVIFVLIKNNSNGSLKYLVLTLAGIPILIQFLSSIWLYSFNYKLFAPSISHINFKFSKDLLKMGGVFFVLQIGALILFQTDNIIITQLFGPTAVTTFNVSFKLFNVIIMIFTIVITPFWSAFTDAYAKNELDWIKDTLRKMQNYWLILCVVTLALLGAADIVYKLWLKDKVQIPFSLSLAMAFYVISYSWQTIHVFLLNGIGKIRLQLYLVIGATIVNIPLAIIWGKWIGLAGVTLSNVFVNVLIGVILTIQCKKILNKTASNIWDK